MGTVSSARERALLVWLGQARWRTSVGEKWFETLNNGWPRRGEKCNFRTEIFPPCGAPGALGWGDSERARYDLSNEIVFGAIANAANFNQTTDTGFKLENLLFIRTSRKRLTKRSEPVCCYDDDGHTAGAAAIWFDRCSAERREPSLLSPMGSVGVSSMACCMLGLCTELNCIKSIIDFVYRQAKHSVLKNTLWLC